MIPTLPPLAILEGEDAYETRDCKCARCAKLLPHAPWCVKSPELKHRPRCPHCGSSATYPLALAVAPKRKLIAQVVNKVDPPGHAERVNPPTSPQPPPRLVYADERERQKALQVIDDLIQRTDEPWARKLYQEQRERILRSSLLDRQPPPSSSPLGPFPSRP